jgi:hypothetical protein
MNNEPASQEDKGAMDSQTELPLTSDVSSYYVDRAGIHVQPFTLHLILGATSPDGNALPSVHLSMNPHFAVFLRDALTEAIAVYSPSDSQADQSRDVVTE